MIIKRKCFNDPSKKVIIGDDSDVMTEISGFSIKYEFDPESGKWKKIRIPTGRSVRIGKDYWDLDNPEAQEALKNEAGEFLSGQDSSEEELVSIPGTPTQKPSKKEKFLNKVKSISSKAKDKYSSVSEKYTEATGRDSLGKDAAIAAGVTAALGAGAYGLHKYLKKKKADKKKAEDKFKK